MSDSLGLVDFAIGLVDSVFNWPDGQVKFFEEFTLQKYCQINMLIKTFFGLVEMLFWSVNVSLGLPEWQAVEITFFAPCQADTGLDNTKEIRDAMLDQVMWKDFRG